MGKDAYLFFLSKWRNQNVQNTIDNERVKRIWLISSNWKKGTPFPGNAILMRDYMSENFKKILSKEKDGIYVELYTKNMD